MEGLCVCVRERDGEKVCADEREGERRAVNKNVSMGVCQWDGAKIEVVRVGNKERERESLCVNVNAKMY